jgi:hypothetical protein
MQMPKRFSDTEKWKKPFIRSLASEYKLFWLYILDDCDHAGIWQVDIEIAEIKLGIKLSLEKARGLFSSKVVAFDNGTKWFIPGFIDFQYGELSDQNRAHKSVIVQLNKYKLMGHLSPLEGAKDKDKELDMDKDKDIPPVKKSWNTKPTYQEVSDLPEIKIGSAIELLKITKQVDVSKSRVTGIWEVFKVQNLTGEKYYADLGAVHSHFINWIKTQRFEDIKQLADTNINARLKETLALKRSA